jgi:short-chain fatty acids transporter
MIARLGVVLNALARRWVPDPFVLAVGLTLVAGLLALPRLDWQPMAVVDVWIDGSGNGKGMWNLLAFGMQMCLILVTGHALAQTRAMRSVIGRLARLPADTSAAVMLVSVVAMTLAYVNWGLGLIGGALLAREVGRVARRDGRPLHYPLVCAAGYCGLLVWHGGFSGSAPLMSTTEAGMTKILGEELAAQVGVLPLGVTVGSTLNLVVTVACLVVVPLVLSALVPRDEAAFVAAPPEIDNPEEEEEAPRPGFAGALDRSAFVVAVPVLLGTAWLVRFFLDGGLARLDPNVVNLTMLTAGLVLHGSTAAYVKAVDRAVRGCSGIILQFPLYAGIMGIMAGSGLVEAAAERLHGLGPGALAVATFYLGGLVNLFVPSGGGQWAVQGPIVMEAAMEAGAEPGRILMALAYGDQWTNMIQPFWALPLLGICRVSAGSIIGYTAVVLFVAQALFVLPLLIA